MTSAAPIASVASPADDEALLGPWAQAFAKFCGGRVELAGAVGGGRSLTFPRVFDRIELIGGVGHFQHHAAMVEHVRRMGFAWGDDGRVLTVPAAGAFNARLAALGMPRCGLSVAYARGSEPAMPLGPWLLRYMAGVITILVNTPAYYEALLGAERRRRGDDPRWGLLSVAHDLSVHALNYQLVPHAAVDDLATRIRAALPERVAAWSDAASLAPLTLTYFYDNDLNRYTYAVWCRCERPRDFAPLFLAERNYSQLLAALQVRLAETAQGRGDVPSGDFDDMGPIAETSFAVE